MDKLKNLLKSDTPTDDTPPAGATGKITGQGSHFPHDDQPSYTAPTTVTGTEPETRGPSDVSAVKPDPALASATGGPETGGKEHVTTIPAQSATTSHTTSSGVEEAKSYNVTNADFPKADSSADGSGTAAIGTTTTYKSSHLPQGDPVSSVIDKDSSDPLTYKKPESGTGSTGVAAGAATAAASTAFSSSQERGPGHENPYKTSSIDPRVDGGHKTSATEATIAGTGATTAARDLAQDRSAKAPETLTTTTDPVERSTVYSQVTSTQGLDETKATTTTSEPTEPAEGKTSVVSKVLGAVGLGGVAGAAAAKLSSDKKESAIDDTTQPTTTTGVDSYTAPVEQGSKVGHHRKESIPTTAYPAGVDSPGAINAPIGGTRASTTAQQTSDTSASHKAAVAGTGAGAVIGAKAVGNDNYTESKDLREHVTGAPTGSAPPTQPEQSAATTAVGSEHYGESKALRENTTSATTAEEPKKEEDHSTRNVALGAGAGAAAVGAAAVGTHEYSKKEAEKAEAEAAKQAAARQKEIEEQQKAAQKQAEEQRKAAEKQAEEQRKAAEKKAAEERKAAEKEAEEQKKQAEKEQKAAEKQAEKEQKAAEKEEKEHQKAIEKEEKKHQKELEKEEKEHQKEIAAAEKKKEKEEKEHQKELEKEQQKKLELEERERQKQALLEVQERHRQVEEEEQRRKAAEAAAVGTGAEHEKDHQKQLELEERERQKQALLEVQERHRKVEEEEQRRKAAEAAAVGTGAGTAAAATHQHEKDIETEQQEKKPSLLKRIFKKRKNSKTGEEEEYSSDEEDHTTAAVAGGSAVGAGAAGAAVLSTKNEPEATTRADPVNPPQTSTTAATTQKPVDPLASTQPPSQTGAAGFVSTGADGQPKYTVVPQPAQEPTEASGTRPKEAVTGLPHHPSKESRTTEDHSSHKHGEGVDTEVPDATATATTGEHGSTSLEERLEAMTHENFGVIDDHKR